MIFVIVDGRAIVDKTFAENKEDSIFNGREFLNHDDYQQMAKHLKEKPDERPNVYLYCIDSKELGIV